MATLSMLSGNLYLAFDVDGTYFLAATAFHPNSCWNSALETALRMLPDPVEGTGSAPLFNFYSEEPPPGTICLQIIQRVTLSQRFDPQGKPHVYVRDGHGYHQVPIIPVK